MKQKNNVILHSLKNIPFLRISSLKVSEKHRLSIMITVFNGKGEQPTNFH